MQSQLYYIEGKFLKEGGKRKSVSFYNDDKFPSNITFDIFPPGVNVAGGNLLMMIKYDYEQ